MKNPISSCGNSIFSRLFYPFIFTVMGLFGTLQVWAQDVPKEVDVDIEAGSETTWYGQPWVWAIGVALFVIIIVAITRNGSRRDA
jgi:hypothetical protein